MLQLNCVTTFMYCKISMNIYKICLLYIILYYNYKYSTLGVLYIFAYSILLRMHKNRTV